MNTICKSAAAEPALRTDAAAGRPLSREGLLAQVREQVEASRTDGRLLGLMVVDLQRMRAVNASFGYALGDRLLEQFAQRLATIARGSDVLGRLGNDEFALLMPGLRNNGHASLAANKLQQALREPFEIDGVPVRIGANIGIALCPEHAATPDALIQHAEQALADARDRKQPCRVYDPREARTESASLLIETELRQAIERHELIQYYQPKVDLHRRVTCGVEALARWQHPVRGWISPAEFIPVAERSGLIVPLTQWSLHAALSGCARNHEHWLCMSVAVNLSAGMLHDPEVVELVTQALNMWEIEPRHLVLEVTESAMMSDPVRSLENLQRLHDLGVVISVDDFGTGYSSLAYLKKLPLRELKIDRAFVYNMAHDPNDAVIVKSVVELAHNFGLRVVAEGVEDQDTLARLEALDCDLVQGYLVARPMPEEDLTRWLQDNGWRPQCVQRRG